VDAKNKLDEIQQLAEKLNDELFLEFGKERVTKLTNGGNLLLGKCYAESDKIFMTYNPGKSKENICKFNTSFAEYNRYWDDYDDKPYAFWRHSKLFFNSQPSLRSWINNATSTFLIPWRTNNIHEFKEDSQLEQKIYDYSGCIVRRMLEHHHAKILIVSGVSTLKCLASRQFLDFDLELSVQLAGSFNKGTNYQCKKVKPNRNYESLTIFQVPHFSRSNSRSKLPQCSARLWNEILNIIPNGN
jgi:hypothetical protein